MSYSYVSSVNQLPKLPSLPVLKNGSTGNTNLSMAGLAPLPMSPRSTTTVKSNLSMSSLPPLPMSPRVPVSYSPITSNLSMRSLPPLSPRNNVSYSPVTNNLSMASLPPLPMSPRVSVSYSPITSNLSMSSLPPLSPRNTVSYSPITSNLSMASLPPLPMSPRVSTPRPEERVHLPSVSVPAYKVWPQLSSESHLEEILSLPVYDIPTLEEVLAKTTQPFLRQRLERMIAEQREYEGRGKSTRGWSARSPQRGVARHELMSQCGVGCFLDPAHEKFPICPKCQLGNEKCNCAIDCGAINSAKIRAKQWGYESIAELADKLLKEKCHQDPSSSNLSVNHLPPISSLRKYK